MSNGGIFLSPSLPAVSQPSTPQRNPGGMDSSYNRQTGHNHEHGHPRPLHHMDSGIDISVGGVNEKQTYRLLSPEEWVRFCRAVGVFRDNENHEVVHPKSSWWPARGFRNGLYRVSKALLGSVYCNRSTTIALREAFDWKRRCHVIAIIRWQWWICSLDYYYS